jgi:hypothetical protein
MACLADVTAKSAGKDDSKIQITITDKPLLLGASDEPGL